MEMRRNSLIVVGVDGWPAADRALAWALDLAEQTGASVEAVTACQPGEPQLDGEGGHDEAERANVVQRAAIERTLSARPESIGVAMLVIEGAPGPVLVEASRRADLLVLGSHGHKLAYEFTVGSTSDHCLRNSHCPVVVIPVPVFDKLRGHEAVATGPA
jgi:nucleotide-binding universal stress UspA family protein